MRDDKIHVHSSKFGRRRLYNAYDPQANRYILKTWLPADMFVEAFIEASANNYKLKIRRVLRTRMDRATKYGCEIPAPESRCRAKDGHLKAISKAELQERLKL